jgi:hypothetical protein
MAAKQKSAPFLAVGIIAAACGLLPPEQDVPAADLPTAAAIASDGSVSDDRITRDHFGCDVMFFGRHLERIYAGRSVSDILAMHRDQLVDLGIGIVGINLSWSEVEPSPPRGGVHSYDWSELDDIVRILHGARIGLKLQLFPSSAWASRVPAKHLNRAGPLKDGREEDWRAFVQALVERYDGDGEEDAFPVDFKVLKMMNVSGEVESKSNWTRLGGTPAEYDRFLSRTTAWIREIDPTLLVARAAANFGNAFDRIASSDELERRLRSAGKNPVLGFFLESMQEEDDYDLLGFQLNYHWSAIAPQIGWARNVLEERGYARPVFANHTRSVLTDHELETALLDPSGAGFGSARSAYFADQAIHTVKKLTLGLASGLRVMFIATLVDGCYPGSAEIKRLEKSYQLSWLFTGLLEGRKPGDDDCGPFSPKPAFYSYRLLVRKLVGAECSAERVSLGADIHCFRFRKEGRSIFILWYEQIGELSTRPGEGSTEIDLPVDAAEVVITRIVTRIGETEPAATRAGAKDGRVGILLTGEPVIVEEI